MVRKGLSLAGKKSAAKTAANDNDEANGQVPATAGEETMDAQDEPDDDLPIVAQSLYFRDVRTRKYGRVPHSVLLDWARELGEYKRTLRRRMAALLRYYFAGKKTPRNAAFVARFRAPRKPAELDEWITFLTGTEELAGLFAFFSMDDGLSVFHRMCNANLALVVSIAKHSPPFKKRLAPLEDLIQMGNFGLMKAVAGYDPERGFTFATYATWWIRHYILRGFNDTGRMIRIPVHLVDVYWRLISLAVKNGLDMENDRMASLEKLAAISGMKPEAVERIFSQADMRSVRSLDQTGPDNEWNLLSSLPDENAVRPDELLEVADFWKSVGGNIRKIMAEKHPKEWKVLCLRFGLEGGEPMILAEVGQAMQLTRERIRQIQVKALHRLREYLARRHIL